MLVFAVFTTTACIFRHGSLYRHSQVIKVIVGTLISCRVPGCAGWQEGHAGVAVSPEVRKVPAPKGAEALRMKQANDVPCIPRLADCLCGRFSCTGHLLADKGDLAPVGGLVGPAGRLVDQLQLDLTAGQRAQVDLLLEPVPIGAGRRADRFGAATACHRRARSIRSLPGDRDR